MHNRYIFLSLLLITWNMVLWAQSPDSVVMRRQLWRGDLSGSYVTERDWTGQAQNYIILKGLAEARFRKKLQSGWQHEHYVHTQLGYTAITDSIWMKSADILKIHLRWMEENKRKVIHTYSLRFQTQWLSTWRINENSRQWMAGFMNPSGLELGYSFSWYFLENSSLMLTPATLQLSVMPRTILSPAAVEDPSIRLPHANMYSRYGFSGTLNIEESFYNNVLVLSHQSHLFCNAISAQKIQFDVSNRVSVRFLKYLQLRLDTSILYQPDQTSKLQYRQEVLLGIFYEKRK
jgi:hypothetical protein